MNKTMLDKTSLYHTLAHLENALKQTQLGTYYLTRAIVEVILCPQQPHLGGIATFLNGFSEDLGFDAYFSNQSIQLAPSEAVSKFAGQLCYYSFGVGSTKNTDAKRYFDNIKRSGHWSVLEHANFGLLIYGIDRSCTHEIVRHRKLHPSQVSQRYCDGKTLRFVERPEYQDDSVLHELFVERIDRISREYGALAKLLLYKQEDGYAVLVGANKRAKRKLVNQAARSLLPNETEAPIYLTGNVRDWRDFINKRATVGADAQIRAVAIQILLKLYQESPLLFDDYDVYELADGSYSASSHFIDNG